MLRNLRRHHRPHHRSPTKFCSSRTSKTFTSLSTNPILLQTGRHPCRLTRHSSHYIQTSTSRSKATVTSAARQNTRLHWATGVRIQGKRLGGLLAANSAQPFCVLEAVAHFIVVDENNANRRDHTTSTIPLLKRMTSIAALSETGDHDVGDLSALATTICRLSADLVNESLPRTARYLP